MCGEQFEKMNCGSQFSSAAQKEAPSTWAFEDRGPHRAACCGRIPGGRASGSFEACFETLLSGILKDDLGLSLGRCQLQERSGPRDGSAGGAVHGRI